MLKSLFFFFLFTLTLFASQKAFISSDDLAQLIAEERVIILDASTQDSYRISHIVHARFLDITKLTYKLPSGAHRIASREFLQEYFQELGLNKTTPIVIYARNSDEELLNSSFAAFVLMQYGFENISLLDGGYMQWVFENELLVSSLEDEEHEANPSLILPLAKEFAVSTEYLYENINKFTLLDSREVALYYGVKKLSNVASFGHIPHAMSADYRYNFLRDSTLRSREELHAMYAAGHKLETNDAIVVYGSSLFDASMNWYILYAHLGYKNVQLYEDSFFEWGNISDLEVSRFIFEEK